jgi:alkylation response protein AidB-like acyl-CoA dehydrogenase
VIVDLRDGPEQERFRTDLRAWLAGAVPALGPAPSGQDHATRRQYDTAWQRLLFEAGYAGIHWPQEFGGRGTTPAEHLIFLEETTKAGAPDEGVNFVGLLHAGPTIIAEGTPEQRQRHLRGDEVWCQGFSEPDAGSDLASLTTRAVRDGNEYVVTGRKIWTSYATVADQCELLVRTDPDVTKHRGLTWLIMPMDSPGVEVRPLRTIDGSEDFAELFLDEVRIPVDNRVGAEHDGWRVAMVTFGFERGTAFVSKLLGMQSLLEHLIEVARPTPVFRERMGSNDEGVRREIAAVAAELDGLWAMTQRNVTRAGRGSVAPAAGSAFKLTFAEVGQHLADLGVRILGATAATRSDLAHQGAARLVHAATFAFSYSIAAGTSQIQRDIIAERGLGLPKGRA